MQRRRNSPEQLKQAAARLTPAVKNEKARDSLFVIPAEAGIYCQITWPIADRYERQYEESVNI